MLSFDSETFRSERFVARLETLLCARPLTQYSLRGRNRKERGRGRGEREYIIILQGASLHPTFLGELAFHPSSKNALPYYRAWKGRPNVLKF